MPRNASGTYSLPAGNPVVTGTPISSTVQNTTMTDVANALTDSLSRSGLGGMLTALPFVDGTVGAPGITFTSEQTSGFYRPGSGQVGVSVLGAQIAYFANDGIYGRQPFKQWNGASYDTLLSAGVATVTLTGDWIFTKQIVANVGVKRGLLGIMPYHNDPSYVSAAIFISTADPVAGDGSDGDFWYKV